MSDLSAPPTATLHVGEPDTSGPLSVLPVFGPPPELAYVSLAEAVALGAAVRELEAGASVGDVLVHHPLDVGLLLYEGEEITGAQQDRTFDRSVLVPAGGKAHVPVSCVEAGRWDGGRHGEAFERFLAAALGAACPAERAGGRPRGSRVTLDDFGAGDRGDAEHSLRDGAVEGARPWHGPELVALTAFALERPATRVRRPSRRR